MEQKLKGFAPCAEMMPSVVIVQQLDPFLPVFMTSRGLNELGISCEELKTIGTDYLASFFNLEDSEYYLSKLKRLMELNDINETYTFFQQVKFKERDEWVWHVGSTRIFLQDKQGKPTHLVTIAIPLDQLKHISNKAERLLAEKNFFHTNLHKFLTLGKREREVLRLVALGTSSPKIAEKLCISVQTVQTHRRSIKTKLGISSGYDFLLYAHAYDLI